MKLPAKRSISCTSITVILGWLAAPAVGEADDHAEVRGMTVSCATWGWEWGTNEMVATMAELKGIGVNWITIHPYARISEEGTVSDLLARHDPNPKWLTRPIEEAHRLGLKILIKPHLAYWGTAFSWRGQISFETEEQWRRFFTTYEAWVLRLVRICAGADGFVVGTELDSTVHFEKEWRRIIQRIRGQTSMPLTYAASWSDFQEVPFWDALDVIGIQWYFPVTDHEGLPHPRELEQSWNRLLSEVGSYAEHQGKKVLLTELGYNRSSSAAVRPWGYTPGGDQAEEIQKRCLAAALQALERSDSLVGAFLWKWFPGDKGGWNFLLSTPALREVIAAHWSRRSQLSP